MAPVAGAAGGGAFPKAREASSSTSSPGAAAAAAAAPREDTPLVAAAMPSQHVFETAAEEAAMSEAFDRVTANRGRRVALTSLAALALLAVGGLVMAKFNSELAGRPGKDSPVAQFRLQGPGPDGKLGVCYDPRHNWNYPHNPKQAFAEDFPKIAEHFRLVRTFYAVYYGVEVMPYVAKAGLKAALGISIANGRAEEEKAAAIRAYNADPGSIAAIYVGNEDLIPVGPFSVDDIIGHIQDLRNAGVKAPIGTAQRINEWLSPSGELDRLAAACDVIGVNIYPYFSTPANGGEAWQLDNQPVENMKGQYNAVMGRYPGQEWKVRITETGWPTGGSRNFAGHDASVDRGSRYFHDWVGWTCGQPWESFYYTAFDLRDGAANPDYEQFFGVMTADGEPKFSLPNGVCW